MADRVLLLLPTSSYKALDFMEAADRLGVEVVIGTDRRQSLESRAPGHTLALDFVRAERGLARILDLARTRPLRAVLGVDDESTVLAALASETLRLPHNPVDSVRTARDKYRSRLRFAEAGMRGPRFDLVPLAEDPAAVAAALEYPCVLKPLGLSASRGVILCEGPSGFVEAFHRIAAILERPEVRARGGDREHLLAESFLPGHEVAVEGLLSSGDLSVLAVFDKPEPMDGPTFEETLFVTPSRHPVATLEALREEVARGCRALGLREGPIHAEARVWNGLPWLLEIAPRTIGGLCSRSLRFAGGLTLEERVLHHALGADVTGAERESAASGVLMLPVRDAGVLRGVRGMDAAREVSGVVDLDITIARGTEVEPLPEGNRYLGFVFARADDPAAVERALREADSLLQPVID